MTASDIHKVAARALTPVMEALVVGAFPADQSDVPHVLASSGCSVAVARTAQQGLDAIRKSAPHLVVVTCRALDMRIEEFLRLLRDQRTPRYTNVIVSTAPFAPTPADCAALMAAGADHVIGALDDRAMLDGVLVSVRRIMALDQAHRARIRDLQTDLRDARSRTAGLDSDLNAARQLQQSLMRDRALSVPGADVSLILRSSGPVGGDLVGHFPAGPGKLGIFGLDVAGHGITSALMTARLAGYLSATTPRQNVALRVDENEDVICRNLAEAVTELNLLVMEDLETEHYFTLFLAILDLETGRVQAVQAGHPHPFVMRAGGDMEQHGIGGLPVGLIPGAEFEVFEIQLYPGDRLICLSDGFPEAEMPDGKFLDDTGVQALLASHARLRGTEMLEAVIWDLSTQRADQAFSDDLSIVMLDYSGPP